MTAQEIQRHRSGIMPGLGSFTVVPANSDFAEPCRELVVFGAGTVHFTGFDGVEDTWTFTTAMSFPQRIDVVTTRVWADSTVAAGNIKGVK